MRTKILLVAVLAVAAFGTPADAGCIGCGGAAAPGAASLSLNGQGTYSRHTLRASCHYQSTPSGGSYVGSLSANAQALSTYDPEIAVSVNCSLSAGGSYSVSGAGTNSTPYEAWASDNTSVPPLLGVSRLCLNASAVWHYGNDHDQAFVARCIYPGLWGNHGELEIEVPIGNN